MTIDDFKIGETVILNRPGADNVNNHKAKISKIIIRNPRIASYLDCILLEGRIKGITYSIMPEDVIKIKLNPLTVKDFKCSK